MLRQAGVIRNRQNIVLLFFDVSGIAASDVPMFDELAVRHTEDVDADVAIRADEAGPMGMNGDDVPISDHAADFAPGVGEGFSRKKLMWFRNPSTPSSAAGVCCV